MNKYSNTAIVASFLGLWINSFFSNEFQLFVGFILIFSFGILHGANDLALIKNVNTHKKVENFYKILLYYVIIVLTGATLFYIIPWLALTLFIIISGYHFGEQQWNEQLKIEARWIKFLYEILYGLIILFLIFTFHASEVQKIILAITGIEVPKFAFLLILKILLSLFTLLSIFFYFKIERLVYPVGY